MVGAAERDGVVIAILRAEASAMAQYPQMMGVRCGVPTDATAAISGGLQSLLAA